MAGVRVTRALVRSLVRDAVIVGENGPAAPPGQPLYLRTAEDDGYILTADGFRLQIGGGPLPTS